MYRVELLPEALTDLLEIKEYVLNDSGSESVSEKLIAKIQKRLRQLELFPESGTLLRDRYKVSNDYRFLVCENYMIFYRYEENVVSVVRVIYGRRDFIRILF